MLAGKRVLVVEAEFLVALDIQRILESAQAAETVFARSAAEAMALASSYWLYALAIVDVPPGSQEAVALINRLLAQHIAIIATTTDGTDPALIGLGVAMVQKPFDEATLLAACAAASVV